MSSSERLTRVSAALRGADLHALVCGTSMNVLMLSGYWPVIGKSVALVTDDGGLGVLLPEGELELAHASGATLEPFKPSATEPDISAIAQGIKTLCLRLGVKPNKIGIEDGAQTVPVGYSAIHFYADTLRRILSQADPDWQLISAQCLLRDLRAVKTPDEIALIRAACAVAQKGFEAAKRLVVPGSREIDVAFAARREFALPAANEGSHRADGFAWCMSGPNSTEAGNAFARSQSRRLLNGDVVLLHANTYLDGYWTDITRTFVCGESHSHSEIFEAVNAARKAALSAIRPGVAAKDVDASAREQLAERNLEQYFTHGLGHEVGFGAIDAAHPPRLHPDSADLLQTGMVFNVEPAIYVPNKVGVRHCDVVVTTTTGCEVLTPWLPI